jgi:hypothetical protein
LSRLRGATLVLAIVGGVTTLVTISQVIGPAAPSAVAFDHTWSKIKCNPSDLAEGLWDDSPGAGENNEAGFFWVANTAEGGNNYCIYSTQIGPISTTENGRVYLRAAVNDGARLLVQFGQGTNGCGHGGPGGSVFFETGIGGRIAHSGFVSGGKELSGLSLPAGRSLTEVCIWIVEQVSATGARYSALIDEIKVGNKRTGAIAWAETFTAPG